MILMSKYKGQQGGKKGPKIRARPSPLFGQCPKEIDSFYVTSSLSVWFQQINIRNTNQLSWAINYQNPYYGGGE